MARPANPKDGSLIKESWNMVVTYLTAAILVFVLTFHLLLHSPLTGKAFDATLSFGYATGNLTYYQVIFGFLLFAAVIHGFNGIRAIAIECLHPTGRVWLLNIIVFVLMAFFLAVGTVTLVVVG